MSAVTLVAWFNYVIWAVIVLADWRRESRWVTSVRAFAAIAWLVVAVL